MGIRGIPANFGGSETVVEEMGALHASQGWDIVAYCRSHNSTTDARIYKGVRRVILPSINRLSLDTPVHSLLSTLHAGLRNTADVIHYHGVGNAMFIPIARLFGKKTIVTVDGFDWRRPKWGSVAKWVLRRSYGWCVRWADAVVSDNQPVYEYFKTEFGRETDIVYYGTDLDFVPGDDGLREFNLRPRDYFLYVGGLIPDKGVHVLVDAYRKMTTDKKLVIIGDTPYFSKYAERLRSNGDPRIVFTGFLYGAKCRQILQRAYAYIHPLLSDGTSPSLLQSMAAGNCVIASDLPETLGVVRGATLTFAAGNSDDLRQKMIWALAHPEEVEQYRIRARERIEAQFTWPIVAGQYAEIYRRVGSRP